MPGRKKTLTQLETIIDDLLDELQPLQFTAPVSHVYNPLEYARAPYTKYLRQYAESPKEIVMIGMNPGHMEKSVVVKPVVVITETTWKLA